MVTLFVRHSVSDYQAWRKVYDEFFETRKQAGVTGEGVYQSVDDPNAVTLMLDFETIEAARAFPENPKLEEAYRQAAAQARRQFGSQRKPRTKSFALAALQALTG